MGMYSFMLYGEREAQLDGMSAPLGRYLVDDVYAASDALMAAGVEFQKKPDDGGMKGLAFAKDPDGYWIEIVKRGQDGKF